MENKLELVTASKHFKHNTGNDRYAQNVAPKSYKDAIRDAALDRKAQQTSAKIKASVRQKINGTETDVGATYLGGFS